MSVSTESEQGTGLDDTAQALDALLHHAAVAPINNVGWIRVTGEDRVRWLNGMLTNAIQTLRPGEGCYNFALNAQGRIQADANVFALDDALLIESNRAAELMTLLDRFIIMDDVELTLMPPEMRLGLLVAGPEAAEALRSEGLMPDGSAELGFARLAWHGVPVDVVVGHAPLVPRFELWTTAAQCGQLEDALQATRVGESAVEMLRLLEGTPLYGVDIREKELPQETAQTRALHFSKGCYLGQEIVERIRSRGNVHRTFTGFRLAGELPAAGVRLYAESTLNDPAARAVGELTSVARVLLPGGPVQVGLGYLRRDALDRGDALAYRDGEAAGQGAEQEKTAGSATPVTLPHRIV